MIKQINFFPAKRIRILGHVLFWIIYWFYFVTISKIYRPESELITLALRYLVTLPIDICATYLTAYFFIDHLVMKKKIWLFVILFPISAFGFMILQRFLMAYITAPLFNMQVSPEYSIFRFSYYYVFFNIYTIAFIFIVIRMILKSLKTQEEPL